MAAIHRRGMLVVLSCHGWINLDARHSRIRATNNEQESFSYDRKPRRGGGSCCASAPPQGVPVASETSNLPLALGLKGRPMGRRLGIASFEIKAAYWVGSNISRRSMRHERESQVFPASLGGRD